MFYNIKYMERALQLAVKGLGNVSPNPMVGAVLVSADGRIIGEGYHRRFGEAHAEVNAINSVRREDRHLIGESTLYVTLEPCCHYGKTPPCAELIIREGIKKVVIGTYDPFSHVDGGGIRMLRDAGIETVIGVCKDKCEAINARFLTAHKLGCPFVILKWAQDRKGYMSVRFSNIEALAPEYIYYDVKFSDEIGLTLMHRLRANHDAIAVGSETVITDNPQLTVRKWHGKNPKRVVFDRRGRVGTPTPEIPEVLSELYKDGITSIMVEGGATLLRSFIEAGLWDMARVEVRPGDSTSYRHGVFDNLVSSILAPAIQRIPDKTISTGTNSIYYYYNNIYVNDYFVENAL